MPPDDDHSEQHDHERGCTGESEKKTKCTQLRHAEPPLACPDDEKRGQEPGFNAPAGGHQKSTKKKPRQDQWGPRRQLSRQILEPCSNGAPFKQRIGWNYNACSTDVSSSSDTVKRGTPRVVLVLSLVRVSLGVEGARIFDVNRRRQNMSPFCTENLRAPLAKNNGGPLNHGCHKACSENTSRHEHFEDDDSKYNTATRLNDHQIHIALNSSSQHWLSIAHESRVAEFFGAPVTQDVLAVDRVPATPVIGNSITCRSP